MSGPSQLQGIRFTPASSRELVTGLVGYVQARYGAFLIDGVTVRRTAGGAVVLSWPVRRDRRGRGHPTIRPSGGAERAAIEREILSAIGFGGERP